MGTSATYEFREGHDPGTRLVSFYIHFDGYPDGASVYFLQMLKQSSDDERGGHVEKFVRNNETAEIIADPGDWEPNYRYVITVHEGLLWVACTGLKYDYEKGEGSYESVHYCSMSDFLLCNAPKDPRLPLIQDQYCGDYLNGFLTDMKKTRHWVESGMWGNASSCLINSDKKIENLLGVKKFSFDKQAINIAEIEALFTELYARRDTEANQKRLLAIVDTAINYLEIKVAGFILSTSMAQ
jgi:hypothetical protein